MAGKALIFGANGFVGGYLVREFTDHGYEALGSDVAESAAHQGLAGYASADLLDAETVERIVREFQPDVIVNLAAISSVGQSWKMPALTMQVNIVGTINILEAACKLLESPKILLVGSSEEYATSDKPLKETDPIDASNPYGISKVTQERFAEVYAEQYGLRIYRTRSFNHTGVEQNPNFVIPSWCKQAAEIDRSGKPGVMRVGNLNVARDFSDVRDVVRAYRMIIESDYAGEVFNIGSGEALTLREILSAIVDLSSQPIEINVDTALIRPSDTPYICSDVTKIRTLLGWAPEYRLKQTIRDLFLDYAK